MHNTYRTKLNSVVSIFLFSFPLFLIVFQNISIGPVKLSWIYSLLVLILVVRRFAAHFYLLEYIFIAVVSLYPLLTWVFCRSNDFNTMLYFGILTGLASFLLILGLDKYEFDLLAKGCFFSCFVFAVWGVFEMYTGNYIFEKESTLFIYENVYGNHYPVTAFSNTNDLSQYLTLISPFSIVYFYNHNKSIIKKFVILLTVVFSLMIIYNAGARLAMISYFGEFFIIFFIRFFIHKDKRHIYILICLLYVIILVSIVFWNNIDAFFTKFIRVDTSSDYFTIRADIYNDLLFSALKHPFGVFGSSYEISTIGPHNLFLFILCDYGWFFAFLFAVALIIISLRLIDRNIVARTNGWSIALFATTMFYPFTSSISSANEQRKVIWIFMAICIAAIKLYSKSIGEHHKSSLYNKTVNHNHPDSEKTSELSNDNNTVSKINLKNIETINVEE